MTLPGVKGTFRAACPSVTAAAGASVTQIFGLGGPASKLDELSGAAPHPASHASPASTRQFHALRSHLLLKHAPSGSVASTRHLQPYL